MKKFDKEYFQNGFNWLHFTGAGLANWILFFIFELSLAQSFLFALTPTILKELGDLISKIFIINWMTKIGFDPAGADHRDLIMALVGSVIATLIILIKGV